MDIEGPNKVQNTNSLAYLIYVFGVGLASVALLIYWGYTSYSLFISILIGGAIQVIFRTTKRMWANAENPPSLEENVIKNPILHGFVETLPTFKVFASLYAIMIFVSLFWYGVGKLFGWLFS